MITDIKNLTCYLLGHVWSWGFYPPEKDCCKRCGQLRWEANHI